MNRRWWRRNIFEIVSILGAGVVWANTDNKFAHQFFSGYKESGFGREGGGMAYLLT